MSAKIAYSYQEAADATGYSIDTVKKAVNSGDLPVQEPEIGGRKISKPVILAVDLERWITGGK